MKKELEWFKAGAEYFGKDFDALANKTQYKEERYLNTGLHWFRDKKRIEVFTSSIDAIDYIKHLFPREDKLFDVTIYYYSISVNKEELEEYFSGERIQFVKTRRDPKEVSKVNTIVFAGNDTMIFDSKPFGVVGIGKERRVYRNKSISDFDEIRAEILKVI